MTSYDHPPEATEPPIETIHTEQSFYAANHEIGWRDRLRQSRLTRSMLGILTAAGVITTATVFEAATPQADSDLEYTVDGTDIGVFVRNSPHEDDPDQAIGRGAYDGDTVQLICGVTNGGPVGPYNNHTWHKVNDLTNGQGSFWINDHWTETPNHANELAPGEPNCDSSAAPSPDVQPAAPVLPFIDYERTVAKDWALAHATDTPPDAGSCTWFVSQALAKGGFPQTTTWNLDIEGLNRDGVRYGTDATKLTSELLAYMRILPYVQVKELGRMNAANNDIPEAEQGDIIIYDWDGRGGPDHADIITGASAGDSEYPLVSGWSEDGANAVDYPQRGWTWSEEHKQWLQSEPSHENMQAWLVHIRTESDLNAN